MQLFLSGATGVVGRPLVPLLLAAGHRVRVVARTPEKASRLRAAGAEPVGLPAYEAPHLAAAMRGCDAVVDLTTHVPPLLRAASRRAWREHDWLRAHGTAAVLAGAREAGVARVLRDSVAFVHADGGDAWLDEDSPLDPREHLASAVVAEEQVLAHGGTVLRFCQLYGPGSPHTVTALRLGRRLHLSTVIGPGDGWVTSLHHDDAAAAVAAALSVAPGVYEVGDEPLRRAGLVRAQAAACGVARLRRPPAALGRGAAEPLTRSQRISSTRFRDASGWAPAYPTARDGWAVTAAA